MLHTESIIETPGMRHHAHTHLKLFIITNSLGTIVFGRWEEPKEPRGNPYENEESV